jgi:hypothetical protein
MSTHLRPKPILSLSLLLASAGCSAVTVTPGAPSARPEQQQVRVARSWILPEAKRAKELLYVGDPTGSPSYSGVIDVFSLRGIKYKLVGQLQDDNFPEGMTTDAAGNLYVTDMGVATEGPAAGDIKVYPKGSTQYTREIVSASWIPFDIAVHKGSLYVANIAPFASFSPGSVTVYPPSASQPSRVLKFPNFQVYGITMHAQTSTIYVSYGASGSGNGDLNEFVRARGKPKNLGVSYGDPWGLLEDGSNDLLACSGDGTIEVYAEKTGTLVKQISVTNGALFLAFDQSYSKLFVTNFQEVEIYSYPNGKLIGSINEAGWGGRSNYPSGVAYWPPPQ